jgi:probable F420-dependent oxidoreductase
MITLGRVGLWTRQLDAQPVARAQELAAEIEALGYRTLWIPEAVEREVLTHAALLLAATDRLVVATGVARIHARSAWATALAQVTLDERFPNRFLLGLGASHPAVIERSLGRPYGKPLAEMSAFLDALDVTLAAPRATNPTEPPERVLAALGPKMMALAAERAGGAHTYLSTVAHTAWARSVLGPGPVLAPAVKALLDTDPERARDATRAQLGMPLRLPAYRDNMLRFGFEEGELGRTPSDRVVDALVAHGDVDAIAARVAEHLAAGADHVCVEVLTGDDTTVPLDAWRRLAPALVALG